MRLSGCSVQLWYRNLFHNSHNRTTCFLISYCHVGRAGLGFLFSQKARVSFCFVLAAGACDWGSSRAAVAPALSFHNPDRSSSESSWWWMADNRNQTNNLGHYTISNLMPAGIFVSSLGNLLRSSRIIIYICIYQMKCLYCESITDKRQLISTITVSCGTIMPTT